MDCPDDSPPVGSVVELIRVGEREPFGNAQVAEVSLPNLVLSGCRAAIETRSIVIRWWDDLDDAWEARASVGAFDAARARLETVIDEDWHAAILRRAVRVDARRQPLDLLTIGGDGRIVRRTRVLCLDMSTLGCRVTGTGPMFAAGDTVQVTGFAASSAAVDARLVRCDNSRFGGWLAGLEFLPHTPDDRALLVAWRDQATGARSDY
ncbi:MAG: PilZ domain-containing protein [Gaiellales bacterium]